jgi:hypothetical protein
VTDAAGDIYVLAEDRYIQKYDPDQPSAAPVCEFEFAKGGVSALTVDPESGEVFFFSEKKEAGFTHKLIHQLSPCAGGAFKEVGKFEVAPERDDLFALALDPAREFSPGRPAGVLYGGAPEAVPPIGPGEPGQSSLGYIFAPPEENPPVIEAESVSKATATTAQLRAVIDPKGFPTHYSFQYITDAAYAENPPGEEFNGATEAPLAGADVQAGQGQTAVAVTLTGLLPDTGYHFRVVAQSNCAPGEPEKICAVQGADETFRTAVAPGPVLPDARAYELVSPAQKNGGQVLPADSRISSCGYPECKPGLGYTRFPLQSSPDGGAIAYEGTTSFTPGAGAPVENSYIARRDPSAGWLTANPTPALMGSRGGNGYKAFDPGLTETLLQQNLPALTAALPEYANLYRQATASPLALENLLTQAPPNRPPGLGSDELELTYRGASADLSRVFFTANDALTAETPSAPEASGGPAGEVNLYEWAAGQLALVNVLPANTASSPGAAFAPAASYGVSADGSRAFWTSKAGGLYVRIDATETRQIEDPGKFLAASADGTEVLLDDGCLYDVEAEACEDLTADQSEVHQGGFGALLGKSEDLSRVYFVIRPTKGTGDLSKGSTAVTDVHATTGAFRVGQAIVGAGIPAGATIVAVGTETLQLSAPATEASADAALAAQGLLTGNEENSEGAKAQAGGPNLYAHEEGSTTFIATLAAKDSAGGADSEASPGGHWLAFLSVAPLTGYDNLGPCEHTGGGETLLIPCPEVFLYDSDTGELRCPSCNSTNARPLGEAVLRQIEGSTQKPRYLTDSGRLFFDTQDSLVAADTNAGAEDVYQFEPAGIGTCGREAGCVSLISGGREATDSNFLAMDPAGENVFFTTRERLLPADTDELIDLYDARVGGGFAFESAPAPSGCSGEACQPALPAPPAPQPNSQAQTEGNYHPPKCKKGQVRRGGKCVKKNQHKGKAKKGKGHAKGQKREGSR